MGFTIDIDTGGTFTDGFFTKGDRTEMVKVPTTAHDLTVCFMNCIREGARKMGASLEDMLSDTEVIRFSTTIGTNIIVQRAGPKLGLIVTRGFEKTLYKDTTASGEIGPLGFLVSQDMVVGIAGEIDVLGNVVKPVRREEVLDAVRYCIDAGARTIVVSLLRASINPENEQRVRVMVNEEYPKHYLGAVPLLLSTQVSDRPGDYPRTITALLNAYFHRDMARYLYKADEDLRRSYYLRPLLVVHSGGGVNRVAKTMAINTYCSGPAAGAVGSAFIGSLYGLRNLVSTDMGGTSLDVAIIADGKYGYTWEALIEGLPTHVSMIEVVSAGAGGGSIARVGLTSKELEVGPQSAGALPGPVAFDLGGTDPTVTDADLVLGYIDENYFLGGRMRLNKQKAMEAINKKIGAALHLKAEEAAFEVKKKIESKIAQHILQEMQKRSYDFRNFALLAYGGAGPTHCCGYADNLGITKIITFPYSPVFCAFGSSTMDVLHTYSRTQPLVLYDPSQGAYFSGYNAFNSVVNGLQETAIRDMKGEGFDQDKLGFALELVMTVGPIQVQIVSPRMFIEAEDDVKAICQVAVSSASCEGEYPQQKIVIRTFILKVAGAVPHWKIPQHMPEGTSPEAPLKGRRSVYWGEPISWKETKIYEHKLLKCGNIVEGPAIIEAEHTTYVIPEAWTFTVDRFLNGVIERKN